jgi:hypothetical protein
LAQQVTKKNWFDYLLDLSAIIWIFCLSLLNGLCFAVAILVLRNAPFFEKYTMVIGGSALLISLIASCAIYLFYKMLDVKGSLLKFVYLTTIGIFFVAMVVPILLNGGVFLSP